MILAYCHHLGSQGFLIMTASYLLVGLTEFQQEVANNLQVLIITTLTVTDVTIIIRPLENPSKRFMISKFEHQIAYMDLRHVRLFPHSLRSSST